MGWAPGREQRWTSAVGCPLPVLSCRLTPGGQSEWFGRKDPEHLAFGDSGGSYTLINSTSACRGSVAKIRMILGGGDMQVINFPNSLFWLHYLLLLLGPLPLNVWGGILTAFLHVIWGSRGSERRTKRSWVFSQYIDFYKRLDEGWPRWMNATRHRCAVSSAIHALPFPQQSRSSSASHLAGAPRMEGAGCPAAAALSLSLWVLMWPT